MKFIFWLSLCFILYTYAGYPCLLFIWSRLFPKKVNKAYFTPEPTVSVIIAAHDEERYIRKRIENLLKQNYPLEKIEIIIVSDGSTDSTNDIVKQFVSGGANQSSTHSNTLCALKLIELDESRGKPHALNIAVSQSTGEYIVFTDARQEFEPNAIKELIGNFNDPSVGCVSGELVFYRDSDSSIKTEMGFYWDLEKHIRRLESSIYSVAGATGAIYAIRKSLFSTIPEEVLLDDVFIPMNIVFHGYRTIFDSDAIAYDTISESLVHEQRRKIRTLLGNYQLLHLLPQLLSPKSNPIFFRYLSHKVFRLFIPFFFLILLFSSLIANGFFYKMTFVFSLSILILPIIDKFVFHVPFLGKVSKLASTFVLLNYFALLAFLYFIRPGKKKGW